MTSRILPQNEWPRLAGTEAESVWPYLDPSRSWVVVVEDDGEIVGCHVLAYVLHAECLWVHPDHRGKASVARRLWATVRKIAQAVGAPTLATAARNETVRELLEHIGAIHLDGEHYSIPLTRVH